ncbi:MAG: TetR/AcrR family transcriptional regulator [Gammaproteobacteria bacterium]|nr:TetR/AcrR family transcriptional regulator [Gammaproteobacteria bacterium]
MPKKPRYRGIRRTATRDALMAAAEELFGLQGFADVSVDEITARAGVAKGSFYNHFTDKADLAHHLALEIRAGMREQIGTLRASSSDDAAVHVAISMGSFMLLAIERPSRALILVNLLSNPTDAASPMNARVRSTLQAGMSSGRFRMASIESALVLVLGIVAAGIRDLLEQRVKDPDQRIAELVAHGLCALGLDWSEAYESIASPTVRRLRLR